MNTYKDATDRTWDRLWAVLDRADPECIAYAYRVDDRGRVIRPFWMKASASYALVDEIQHRGGGRLRIIVRRGRTIVFAAYLAFAGLVGSAQRP